MDVGRHVSHINGIIGIPEFAHQMGCQIFQMFSGSSRVILNSKKNKELLVSFSQKLKQYSLKVVIHGIYTINFCSPINTPLHHTSIHSTIQDLHTASIIGNRCLGIIIHMGRNAEKYKQSNEVALKNYISGLKEVLRQSPRNATLILETGASTGNEIGSKLEGLAQIYHSFTKEERKRIKFCIDTCHIWATGYCIDDKTNVLDYFQQFNKLIGIKKIACFHFNNSLDDCGSHKDHHANLTTGKISQKGLRTVARVAKKYSIPIVLETPAIAEGPHSFKNEKKLIKEWVGA